jgi:iron complex transport system permease protein
VTVAEAWVARVSGGRAAPLTRALLVWGAPLALLALGILLGLSLGAVNLGPARVFDGLMDRGDTLARTIVWDLRLPRVLLAALVGASLGVSGGLLQGVTRNPLADPHILGLTAGGGLAAAIAIRASQDFPDEFIPPIAFGGSMIGAAVVYGTSWRGGASPLRLALAGVAVASLLTAGTTMILVTSNLFTQAALAWLAGGLFGRGWEELRAVWPFAIVGIGAAILLSRSMNVLSLGDEAAQSLGLDVERTRLFAIGIAALLAGAAVSAAGMVAFVGLVIPHIARFLTGDDHRRLLPLSVVLGASLVVYADIFARVVQAPVEIPMGIVTAAIGAPFLLYLIRART